MIQVVEVVGRAEQGVTEPFVWRCDDDEIWYVKSAMSAGRWSLVCEWVAGHAGQAFGLPLPEFSVIDVPQELMALQDSMPELLHLGAGLAFGSKQVPGAVEITANLVDQVPLQLRRDVLAFDWWVRNGDRILSERGGNPNLLWQAQSRQLMVIDHNQAFDEQLEASNFLQAHVFHAEVPNLWGDMWQRNAYTDRFSEALAQIWPRIVRTMPQEWLFRDEGMTEPVDFRLDDFYKLLARCGREDFWSLT